jgi:periplasmic protein TonB
MSADEIVLTADSVNAPARLQTGRRDRWSRGFWIGLACAAAVHAVLIIGVARHAPRYLGAAGGAADAINVELVDEADLKSRETSTGNSPPPGALVPPPQPQSEPAPESPPPQPEAKQPVEKTPPEQKAEKTPEPKAELPAEAAPADQPASLLPVEKEKPQSAPPQAGHAKEDAKEKKAEAEAEAAKKLELKPPNQLDLSLPKEMSMAQPFDNFGSASSAVGRPPGITRSGANDDFGRGVIRALKKTMPPATGTKGRLTIRLILDERGNIATLKLVKAAGIRDLDEGVMFSAQQASFPFPPQGATVADRTFLITYVYN